MKTNETTNKDQKEDSPLLGSAGQTQFFSTPPRFTRKDLKEIVEKSKIMNYDCERNTNDELVKERQKITTTFILPTLSELKFKQSPSSDVRTAKVVILFDINTQISSNRSILIHDRYIYSLMHYAGEIYLLKIPKDNIRSTSDAFDLKFAEITGINDPIIGSSENPIIKVGTANEGIEALVSKFNPLWDHAPLNIHEFENSSKNCCTIS